MPWPALSILLLFVALPGCHWAPIFQGGGEDASAVLDMSFPCAPACPAGEVCAGGACVVGNCLTSDDCPGNWPCQAHRCVPCGVPSTNSDAGGGGCCSTLDCAGSNQVCARPDVNQPGACVDCGAGDGGGQSCAPGQACCGGRCYPGSCCGDADCRDGAKDKAVGWVCVAHACVPCADDGQCAGGDRCCNGVCRPGTCCDNADCASGTVCKNDGNGGPNGCGACATHDDCDVGRVCCGGACVIGSCCQDADCGAGHCVKNGCAP